MATLSEHALIGKVDTQQPAASPSYAGWGRLAIILIAALLAAAAAAWLGYQGHAGLSNPSPSASASSSAPPKPLGEAAQQMRPRDATAQTSPAGQASTQNAAAPNQLSWPIWEFRLRQPIPPREPSLTPPTWRLIGSSLTRGKWSVIVLRQGSVAPEYFSVGEELPGGYRIESINDEDVTLAQGKRLMVLSYIGSR